MVAAQAPITRKQLLALVKLYGCYISARAFSDQWHIRMKTPEVFIWKAGTAFYRQSIEVCQWGKDLSADYWVSEFPKAVRVTEDMLRVKSFAGRGAFSGSRTSRV